VREIPDLDKIHRRHKDVKPEPMFDVPPSAIGEPTPKPKRRRKFGERKCPACGQTITVYMERMTISGRVLVFKKHDRVTYGGHRFPCAGSDAQA
jgi:hypothetical protein